MPARPKLADPGQLIRGAKRRTDTYDLCTNPDLVAEHEDLLARLADERAAASDSLDGGGQAAALKADLEALLARIGAETVELTFTSLPRPRYRALINAHPPVKDEDGEVADGRSKRMGVDYDTFFAELLRLSLTAPDLDAETLTVLIDEVLSAGQWRGICTVLWNLNEGEVDIPFSPAVSRKTRASSPR